MGWGGPEVGTRAARAFCHLISPRVHARKNPTYEPDIWAPALSEPPAHCKRRGREEGGWELGIVGCLYGYVVL